LHLQLCSLVFAWSSAFSLAVLIHVGGWCMHLCGFWGRGIWVFVDRVGLQSSIL
jgi:hypothetical protein